jgi:hypothetical protein
LSYLLLRDGRHGIHFYPPRPGEFVSLGGDTLPAVWDGQTVVIAQIGALIKTGILFNLEISLQDAEPPHGEFYIFGQLVRVANYISQLDAVYLEPVLSST